MHISYSYTNNNNDSIQNEQFQKQVTLKLHIGTKNVKPLTL